MVRRAPRQRGGFLALRSRLQRGEHFVFLLLCVEEGRDEFFDVVYRSSLLNPAPPLLPQGGIGPVDYQ